MGFSKLNRRNFLRMSGGAVAGATLYSHLGSFKSLASSGKSPEGIAKGKREHIPSACAMCVNKCGIVAEVVDGKLHKINPNKKHIKSRGMLCAKGNAGAALPYSPERLKKPLLRTGKRGEGKWKEISWEESYRLIAKKLAGFKEKYQNRSSVAFASTEGLQEEFFYYIVNAFGSMNTVRHPSLCLSSTIQGWSSVFGFYPDADLHNAQFVIMMGADRAQAFITPDSVDFVRYKPKGQKLIYLDPRYTETAAKADKWFPVKPGTDMAFILGIIHEIIDKEMYDREFIETYTHGFSELAAFVKEKGYTPEWAEEKCEIPASEIRWCARQFAANAPRSVVYPGRRSSFYWKEVYFRRACAILAALCGCWDTKGAVAPKASISLNSHSPLFPFFMQAKNRIDEEAVETVKNLVPSAIKCPMVGTGLPEDSCAFLSERDGSWVTFREAILNDDPYPVRGLFVFKQNPVQAVPNVKKTLKMMEKMEFICVVEQQMSDTAWYADLVLPHSTYLESWDPCHVLSGIWPSVVFRQPVIKPMFDTRTMFEISRGVIEEMLKIPSLWDDTDEQAVKDFKKDVVDGILKHSVRDIIKFQLSKHPGAHEKIMQDGVFFLSDKPQYGSTRKPGYRFSTKSGKIELLNERYKQRGLFELPEYCEPKTEPDKDTYRFLVGRRAWNTHAGTQNIPYLWEIQKENSIWINTREAEKLGVRTGDYVHVTSSVGEQKVRVLATEAIRPDCVYFVNGWNRRSPRMSLVYKRGASEAEILEDTLESISGSAAMHETLVRIRRA